jgi:uncharacterized glyoxalase superfamily protein PhnB
LSDRPPIRCEQVIPTLAVGDVARAIGWYVDVLGFDEAWRWGEPPAHAAITLDGHQIHLSRSEPSPGGSWLYFVVDHVDALYERLLTKGVDVVHAPEDQQWNMRELPIRDLVGNELTLATPCAGGGPELVVEREVVPLRLEKRLLAVLRDLAEHKGFDLTELLEETVLHTFEPMGSQGVASPHTAADLAHIAELKARHGIDYDTHAAYRFVEKRDDRAEDA